MERVHPFDWLLRQVQEKEKLYLSLKQILSRQPGPEVAEQLMLCQGSLRHKTRQMKASDTTYLT